MGTLLRFIFRDLVGISFQNYWMFKNKNWNCPNACNFACIGKYSNMNKQNKFSILSRSYTSTSRFTDFDPFNHGPGYNWYFFFQRYRYFVTNIVIKKLRGMVARELTYKRRVMLQDLIKMWEKDLKEMNEFITAHSANVKRVPRHGSAWARKNFIWKHDMKVLDMFITAAQQDLAKETNPERKAEFEIIIKECNDMKVTGFE